MPLFEYKCLHCNLTIEVLQTRKETAPICVKCESTHKAKIPMQKQVSKTSFSLKGSGWAKDGYGLREGR